MSDPQPSAYTHLAARVVSAYVQGNHLTKDSLPDLIGAVHHKLRALDGHGTASPRARDGRPGGYGAEGGSGDVTPATATHDLGDDGA